MLNWKVTCYLSNLWTKFFILSFFCAFTEVGFLNFYFYLLKWFFMRATVLFLEHWFLVLYPPLRKMT